MARTLRRADLAGPVLAALVAASALLHWLGARRFSGVWIMPDEVTYADRAVRLYHHGSIPVFRGAGAGYGLVYPIVAGLPLSVGSFAVTQPWLQAEQSLVVSLAAIPVYFYGRRLMPDRWALVAAALTLASPLLLYSGLVMTEVVFYPVSALAVLAIARAIATTSRRDQVIALALVGVAILTRTQAVVFIAVFALGAALDAALARDSERLRAFWPVWVVTAAGLVVGLARPNTLGAYRSTISGGYPAGRGLGLTYDHLAYLVFAVGVMPIAALAVLTIEAVRRREMTAEVRAFLAVTLCAIVLVALQVGFFAARYAPHLLGRDLAALEPLAYVALCIWLSRVERPSYVTGAVAAFAVVATVVLAPWNRLSDRAALPDSFGLAIVRAVAGLSAADVVAVTVGVAALLFVAVPRRAIVALPAMVLAFLVASSVSGSNMITRNVKANQIGTPREWVDIAPGGSATYFYDVEPPNVAYQTQFWNHRVTDIVSTFQRGVFDVPLSVQVPPASGRIATTNRYIIATQSHSFVGTEVVHVDLPEGMPEGGLTLWHLSGRPRLSIVSTGILPNGDMTRPAELDVYDCGGGSLQLVLLPKSTTTLRVLLDGNTVVNENVAKRPYVNVTVNVPPSRRPRLCVFTIEPQVLLGSTQIDFSRP